MKAIGMTGEWAAETRDEDEGLARRTVAAMVTVAGAVMFRKEVGSGAGLLGEFSAVLYFSALRRAGCDPVVRDGAVYADLGEGTIVRRWAAAYDRDGAMRLGYARAIWETRPPGARIIELG